MRPTSLSLWVIAGLIVMALVSPAFLLWKYILGTWLAVLSIDALLAFTQSSVDVSRSVPTNLSVNRGAKVVLNLNNLERRTLLLYVQDELPQFTEAEGAKRDVELAPGQSATMEYRLQPTRRGNGRFGAVSLLIQSPCRFWQLRRRYFIDSSIRVYPDFTAINQYLELNSDQRSRRLGLKVKPRRGEGMEFHQLKEYHPNDGIRAIDWKATARRRTLISRQYSVERDQRVVFLLDTGSRMRAKDGALSHFDHALNAMLLLSHVALRQGDTVALKTFGPTRLWLPELRGVGAMTRLLNTLYTVHSGPQTADYAGAAEELMQQQRKRSLVILMTNLRAEDSDLVPALKLLRKRHVVLLASLRESVVEDVLAAPVKNFDQALNVAGASRYLRQRKLAQNALARDAHVLIDSIPTRLPIELVNSYWQLKSAGTL